MNKTKVLSELKPSLETTVQQGMRKITYSESTIYTDKLSHTTEQVETQQNVRISAEPAYIKLYLASVLKLKDISVTLSPILYELLRLAPFAEDAELLLPALIRKRIATACDVSIGHVNNTINSFLKKEILIRSYDAKTGEVNRAAFFLNPYLFARGDWSSIEKLRLTLVIDNEGNKYMSGSTQRKGEKEFKENK
jgi:hypothetical protein